MKKGAYLWCGIALLAVCVLFTILSWTICEPCEFKLFPSLVNGAFIMLALIFLFVGLTKEDEKAIIVSDEQKKE